MKLIRRVELKVGNRRGASMVEYAVLAALIALAAIVMVGTLGKKVTKTFQSIESQM